MLRPVQDLLSLAIVSSRGADDEGDTIGQLKDLLFDDSAWTIRYLVVSTSNWWFGQDVLVAPQWIQRMSWADHSVTVEVTRNTLALSPRYDPETPLTREMEIALFQHHRRTADWTDEALLATSTKTPRDANQHSHA